MPARRTRGEGALYWDESRQRWMAAVDVGFSPTGKRQRQWVTGKTKTEAKQKLLALRRDQSDVLPTEHRTYTVREAVESWLEHGLTGRDEHRDQSHDSGKDSRDPSLGKPPSRRSQF